MRKTLLSLVAIVALVGYVNAQTIYLDFEGTFSNAETFGGSTFSVVDNPSKTGVNTSNKVVKTFKEGTGIQTWGGNAYFVGGTIDFGPGAKTFSMDVWCAVAGSTMFKVEKGAVNVEIPVAYTTPGQWQTITYTFNDLVPALYDKVAIFMGHNSTATDVWYFDNLKGISFTAGATVDATVSITDLGGTATGVEVEFLNNSGTKIALIGTAGVGSVWTRAFTGVTGSTITAPVNYTIYVNGAAIPELSGLGFAMAGSAASTLSKNYGVTPVGFNLITNGTFDGIEGPMAGQAGNAWGMYSANGGALSVINGVATVTPVANAVNTWQMQLEQKNFVIENGKTYTATFEAWSDANRAIDLTMEDPANAYRLLGTTADANGTQEKPADLSLRSKWNFNITTVKAKYTATITVDKVVSNTQTKFAFLMAQTADKVYIDNVTLMEATNVSVSANRADAVKLYPNPAENNLYIVSKSALKKVEIYNVVGKQVKEYDDVLQSINVSDLKTGVYMIRLTDVKGKTVTSKFIKK